MTPFEYTNCNLCDADDTELVFIASDNQFHLNGQFKLVKCKRCGLIYVNPRPTQKEIKFYYPKQRYYSCQEPCQKKHFDQRIKSLIRQSLPGYNKRINIMRWVMGRAIGAILLRQIDIVVPFKKGGKILDVGCGNGEMIGWMKECGWETYGTDISREACEQAEKHGLDVFCGELRDAPRHLYHFTRDTLNKILNAAGFEVHKWKFKFPFPVYDHVSIKFYKENNEGISSKHLLRRSILKDPLFKLIKYFLSKDRGPRFSVNLTAYASKSL